jgi:hypothetical protein
VQGLVSQRDELRERKDIEVRIMEPADQVPTRRGPDILIVLAHPLVAK